MSLERTCLWMAVIVLLEGGARGSRAVVETCEQLQAAVHSAAVTRILVQGSIATCDCQWKEEESPARPLEITGSTDSTLELGILDRNNQSWRLGPGSSVYLANLKILEVYSPSMGLEFLRDLSRNGVVVLDHAMLVLAQCTSDQQMERNLQKLVNREQDTTAKFCSMGHQGVHVESLKLHSELGHYIQMTETTITCGNSTNSIFDAGRLGIPIKSCQQNEIFLRGMLLKVLLPFGLVALLFLAIPFWFVMKKLGMFQQPEKQETVALGPKVAPSVNDMDEPYTIQDIKVGLLIGKGNFSSVFRGSYDGVQVAIKILEHDSSLAMEGAEPLEVVIGRKFAHPNVVRTLAQRKYKWENFCGGGLFETEVDSSKSTASSVDDFYSIEFHQANEGHNLVRSLLVMEYCLYGSLCSTIRKGVLKNNHYMANVLQVLIDVAAGMEHIHKADVIHGDLKTQNVFLAESGDSQRCFICKVGDFGMSRLSGTSHPQIQGCGSVKAMPPEVFSSGTITQAADVYSFGIILWELLSGKEPYVGWNHHKIVYSVIAGQRPKTSPKWPQGLVSLMENCWQESYSERPNFVQILQSLQGMDAQALDAHLIAGSSDANEAEFKRNEEFGNQ